MNWSCCIYPSLCMWPNQWRWQRTSSRVALSAVAVLQEISHNRHQNASYSFFWICVRQMSRLNSPETDWINWYLYHAYLKQVLLWNASHCHDRHIELDTCMTLVWRTVISTLQAPSGVCNTGFNSFNAAVVDHAIWECVFAIKVEVPCSSRCLFMKC